MIVIGDSGSDRWKWQVKVTGESDRWQFRQQWHVKLTVYIDRGECQFELTGDRYSGIWQRQLKGIDDRWHQQVKIDRGQWDMKVDNESWQLQVEGDMWLVKITGRGDNEKWQ